MSAGAKTGISTEANVQQAVPFFRVSDIQRSVRFYVDGLGFQMTKQWIDEGTLRWCWLQIGDAALMLQEYRKEKLQDWAPNGKLGAGVSVCFQCKDALEIYREITSRGIEASEPFVGNRMWCVFVADPDGYKLEFESFTESEIPEETKLSEWNG